MGIINACTEVMHQIGIIRKKSSGRCSNEQARYLSISEISNILRIYNTN